MTMKAYEGKRTICYVKDDEGYKGKRIRCYVKDGELMKTKTSTLRKRW